MSNLHPSLGIVSNKSNKIKVYRRRAPKHTPPPDVQNINIEEFLDQYEPFDIEYMINFPLDKTLDKILEETLEEIDNNKITKYSNVEVALKDEPAITKTVEVVEEVKVEPDPSKKFKHKPRKTRKKKDAPTNPQSK